MINDTMKKALFAGFLLALGAVGAASVVSASRASPKEAVLSAMAGESDSGEQGSASMIEEGGVERDAEHKSAFVALANGSAVSEYQTRFEKAVPFREFAVRAMGKFRWDLFAQGYDGMLAGEGDWLFSTEEFKPDLGYLREDLAGLLSRTRVELDRRGIALIVVPIPAKAVVEMDRLGRYEPSRPMMDRHGAFLALLGRLDIAAVDLMPAFLGSAEPAFLHTDTHWSTEGARLAAAGIARLAESLPVASAIARTAYLAEPGTTEAVVGDLLSFLPSGGGAFRKAPGPELIETVQAVPVPGSGGLAASLFGAQEIPVALVGTSYSASSLWGFEGFLKLALSADVLGLASEGLGPFVPMQAALDEDHFSAVGTRLVIWEIPERFIPFDELNL